MTPNIAETVAFVTFTGSFIVAVVLPLLFL